jgi:hypothetical protein
MANQSDVGYYWHFGLKDGQPFCEKRYFDGRVEKA